MIIETRVSPWLVWLSGLSQWIEPKGYQFNSQLGYMPGLWARPLVGGVQETTDPRVSRTLMFLSLSFSLPSPLCKSK